MSVLLTYIINFAGRRLFFKSPFFHEKPPHKCHSEEKEWLHGDFWSAGKKSNVACNKFKIRAIFLSSINANKNNSLKTNLYCIAFVQTKRRISGILYWRTLDRSHRKTINCFKKKRYLKITNEK